MNSKMGSLEEKVKLPPTETISRCYQPPGKNRKVIRILTVAVYVLCVSLAAIMLSLYYIFIWDPTIRPFVTSSNNCDKIVIPEKIAIRLLNSSEVTAEQFYKHILEQYRILSQLQQQRQQFLQKQHLQLQQLAAANKFQEIFATATIIQSNPNDPLRKPITPTNGTFLLGARPMGMEISARIPILDTAPAPIPVLAPAPPSIYGSTAPTVTSHTAHNKRKQHRKHSSHHRHNARKNHARKPYQNTEQELSEPYAGETPHNAPILSIVQEPYTQLPIPLILNSKEDKRPYHAHAEKKANALARKRAHSSDYEAPTYLNPFLTGELIFEK